MSFKENSRRFNEWLKAVDDRDEAKISRMINEWVAEDYVFHNGGSTLWEPADVVGRQGMREHTRAAFDACSSIEHVVEDAFGDDSRLATRTRVRAVVKGDFLGIAAAGHQFECSVIYISHFRNGQLREGWVDWDSLLTVRVSRHDGGQP